MELPHTDVGNPGGCRASLGIAFGHVMSGRQLNTMILSSEGRLELKMYICKSSAHRFFKTKSKCAHQRNECGQRKEETQGLCLGTPPLRGG